MQKENGLCSEVTESLKMVSCTCRVSSQDLWHRNYGKTITESSIGYLQLDCLMIRLAISKKYQLVTNELADVETDT